jgi:RNA polymerase sigma factor (sigma-70 family)
VSPTATDESLAREASGGGERALAKIFRSYHQPLYRYCLAIVGSRQDAEDALQETMVKVLRALPGEKREIALKPWLYRIAHNESIDLLRRRREGVSLEEGEPAVGEGLAEQVETRQRLRQLIADLGSLPDRQRGVLLMREAAGLDFDEIAVALKTTPAVARQTLYEARLGLRQMHAGREMDCDAVTRTLSDGDRRLRRRRDIRAHLRDCGDCRRFGEEMDSRRGALAAISPLPAVTAAAMLHGLIGGGGGAAAGGAGTGVGSLVGGSAAKSIGTATLLKGAASVALIAAIGIGAADKGGLIHIGSHHSAPKARLAPRVPAGVDRAGVSRSSSKAAPSANSGKALASNRTGSRESATGSSRPHRAVLPAGAANPKPQEHGAANGSAAPALNPGPSEANTAAPLAEPGPVATSSADDSASPGKSGLEHPHGHGHVKQTPSSAEHGQETAASHKPEKASTPGNSAEAKSPHGGPGKTESAEAPAPHGNSGGADHPVPPTHPAHPAHPTNPANPEEAAAPPVAEEPAAETHGKKPD